MAEMPELLIARTDHGLCRPGLFEELSSGERRFRQLCRSMPPLTHDKGHVLIAAGKPSLGVMRLARGWAIRRRCFSDGRVAILSVYLPGEIVGIEAAMLSRSPDETVLVSPGTVHFLDNRMVRGLWSEPATAIYFSWLLAQTQRNTDLTAAALGRQHARERLAAMLIDLYSRLRSAEMTPRHTFNMPLTQQQIGDYLGLTVVHVNRTFRWLRDQHIAYVDKHLVVIKDLERLHQCTVDQPAELGAPSDIVA